MKLYLPQKQVHVVTNIDEIDILSKKFCKEIANLQKILVQEPDQLVSEKIMTESPPKG